MEVEGCLGVWGDTAQGPDSFWTFSRNFSAVRYIKTLPPPGTMPISCQLRFRAQGSDLVGSVGRS